MKETTAPSWGDFVNIIREVEGREVEGLGEKAQEDHYVSELFYRGQADSHWHLETTLERSVRYVVSLNEYYGISIKAKPRIETFTDTSWEIPTYKQYSNWLKKEPPPYPPFNYYSNIGTNRVSQEASQNEHSLILFVRYRGQSLSNTCCRHIPSSPKV